MINLKPYTSLQDIYDRVPGGGSVTMGEMNIFNYLIEAVSKIDGDIIEIGSYSGRSAATLAFTRDIWSPGKRVFTVDQDPKPDLADNLANIFREGFDSIILGHSPEAVEQLPDDIKFSMAFIDGEHSFDQGKLDLNAIERRLSRGGCIAFHDAFHYPEIAALIDREVTANRGYGEVHFFEKNLAYVFNVGL